MVSSFCDALKVCRFSAGIATLECTAMLIFASRYRYLFCHSKGHFFLFFMSPFFMIILLFFPSKAIRWNMFCVTCAKRVKKNSWRVAYTRGSKSHVQKLTAKTRSRTFLWMCNVWFAFHIWNMPCLHQDRARTHETRIPAYMERFFIASHLASALSHQFEIAWRITLSHWGTHLEFAVLRCDVGWCDVGRIFEFPANVRDYAISECFDACWNWNVWAMRNCHWWGRGSVCWIADEGCSHFALRTV